MYCSRGLLTAALIVLSFATHAADFKDLEKTAFDASQDLETRWRAVTALGRSHSEKAQPVLEKAMQSASWFMRNAALIVVPYGDRTWGRKWAEKLLDDPALVVRTAAVQAIKKMHSVESRQVLWKHLNSRKNFHNGQPLWVRRHIIETLEQFSVGEDQEAFRDASTDEDPAVRQVAVRAMKKFAPVQGQLARTKKKI